MFHPKCFKCKHSPLIRRQCCKNFLKCNYTSIWMRPFMCPACAHTFIIILMMENYKIPRQQGLSFVKKRHTGSIIWRSIKAVQQGRGTTGREKRKQRSTRKIIVSVNHGYFLGGCIHGANKLVGRSDVSPALPLPPTV